VTAPVLALVLLQLKHFAADFVLQTERQVRFKGVYGAAPGIQHAGTHALLTLPCLLAAGVAPVAALAAAGAELAVHYHQDWLKERVGRLAALTPANRGYWMLLGADQLVHQLTYAAMVGLLV
jgi:hypothetical protein